MTKDEALKLALEALENCTTWHLTRQQFDKNETAITAIKQALAAQHEPENEPFVSLASVQEPVGLIDRLTNPEDHYEFTDPKKANAVLMSLCQEAADALAAPVQEPVAWIEHHKGGDNLEWDNPGGKCTPLYTTPPAAQPAVPDAMTSADIQEHIEYVAGWNDCRQAMMEMMK
jgi:hypothetical protein